MSLDRTQPPAIQPPGEWFENAVFYKLPVKSFFDASADGIGDFQGLTQKLDYISHLGATCIWLLPFFPSPLKDDGYDVADYRAVHPAYGTMDDFRGFIRAAHDRGLRVAAEMVINHTSDEHPWFEAARHSQPGSPQRDFYVWSGSPDRFRGGSVSHEAVGQTSEASTAHWTWEAAAGAFYWHRFGKHQPDLNYANELVRAEMLKVLRFWADLRIDGLCLNGAAYLVEREGTTGEHLQETHEVLKFFRRELQAGYPHLMIQAGVNAWPGEAQAYIAGDECHMAPNLAIAPRMFLSLKQETSRPLVDILRQTPTLPGGCQWVTLLRNHDELTLTLATDEERDYLFQYYAADSAKRLNGGILRRLAPLAENCRRQIELLFGLLFALPGSPVIYYGDEIGMGDNVLLGNRNGVRTPMQWTADRNGGFSQADFARLFAPPVTDPIFGFQTVNVDAQQRDTSSMLHWLRRLIAVRKKNPVLAHGELELLEPANQKIIGFIRRLPGAAAARSDGTDRADEVFLVVANLARTAQPAELELSSFAGLIPLEVFGRTEFPRIGKSPYLFTLAPHAFYWFRLVHEAAPTISQLAAVETQEVSQIPVVDWSNAGEEVLSDRIRGELERRVLAGFLKSQRWFGGKARQIDRITIVDWSPFRMPEVQAFHVLLQVEFTEGQRDLYFLPLLLAEGAEALAAYQEQRPWVVARLEGPERSAMLLDALASNKFCSALLTMIGAAGQFSTPGGAVQAEATPVFNELRGTAADPPAPRLGPATSSNSLVFFGRRLLLKVFRRLEQGTNPDYEIGRFLTATNRFSRTPPVAGKLEWGRHDGGTFTLGILQALVPNQGDGWGHALDELGRYFTRASARMFAPDVLQPDNRSALELASESPPPAALETIGVYLYAAGTLGRRTAQMHLALASDAGNADFAPEPLTAADLQGMRQEIEEQGRQAFSALAANVDRLPPSIAADAKLVLKAGPGELERIIGTWSGVPAAMKTRVHGDFHLGQVLWVDNDYVILDFEGEPTRTVEARRAKFSPLRDVAGILRSYHYAAYAGLFSFCQDRPEDLPRLAAWADLWQQWVSGAFLSEYRRVAEGAPILPPQPLELAQLLDMFVLSKALYELVYELNNRPDWVRIPLSGVMRLLVRPLTTPLEETAS